MTANLWRLFKVCIQD